MLSIWKFQDKVYQAVTFTSTFQKTFGVFSLWRPVSCNDNNYVSLLCDDKVCHPDSWFMMTGVNYDMRVFIKIRVQYVRMRCQPIKNDSYRIWVSYFTLAWHVHFFWMSISSEKGTSALENGMLNFLIYWSSLYGIIL